MILVTGGTGLVGAHLLFELTKKEALVKATFRASSDLKKVEKTFSYYAQDYQSQYQKIVWVEADINDIPALDMAFEDITQVYHCAALISFNPRDYSALYKINCEGTANIVNICIAYKIEKLCYVSSIATIGKDLNSQEVNEESEWNSKEANVYALSKYDAEMEVWRGAQEGLKVVILNPGIIIGPGFWKTGSGKLFTIAAKESNYYPPSGTGFVAVEDVVQLLILAMNSNLDKERFVCIAENISYQEVLTQITRALGLKPPTKRIAFWQLNIVWRLDYLRSLFFRTDRKITKNTVESLKENKLYSHQKIKKTFSYTFDPIQKSIAFTSSKFEEERIKD